METPEEIQKNLENEFPGLKLQLERNAFLVDRKDLLAVVRFLKEDGMDYISCVTGVDYKEYLECVYHFYSMEKKHGPIVLKVRVTKEDSKIPSLTPLYRGAEFQEREAYDMIGILFEGHSNPFVNTASKPHKGCIPLFIFVPNYVTA